MCRLAGFRSAAVAARCGSSGSACNSSKESSRRSTMMRNFLSARYSSIVATVTPPRCGLDHAGFLLLRHVHERDVREIAGIVIAARNQRSREAPPRDTRISPLWMRTPFTITEGTGDRASAAERQVTQVTLPPCIMISSTIMRAPYKVR